MRGLLLVLLTAVLLLPGGAAQAPESSRPLEVPGLDLPGGGQCAGPPCGWIDPVLDLRLPDKLPCDAGLGQAPEPDSCHRVAPGESLVLEGTMVWWWDVSQDGTYPMDPAQDIVITFGPTARDPSWLPFRMEPDTFTLSNAELVDPANYKQEQVPGSAVPRTLFWYEQPVKLTVERTGLPTAEDADLAGQRGFESVFVKARSTASGDRFRASFGIEEVRLLADPAPSQDTPIPLWPVLTLPAVAAWRRARQGL